ncbi:MAG: WHG domain-containing protein [Micromonosporaceae bacterium]|nr:WHG domain-containing protein [Micromonosporaceae bacterium]
MKRPSYHHGDLANALTTAATQLAREGGPDAIVLREAARQVGVSATAAYRHFAGHGDLMSAVQKRAMDELAGAMRSALAATGAESDPRAEAMRRLRALGLGYLRFALAEPGLFRTAFCRPTPGMPDKPAQDMSVVGPYQMLVDSIDRFVDVGLLALERRPWAETFAWSSVHGLAILLLDGPLRHCPPPDRDQIIDRVLDGVVAGLTAA